MIYNIIISENVYEKMKASEISGSFTRISIESENFRIIKADSNEVKLITSEITPAVASLIEQDYPYGDKLLHLSNLIIYGNTLGQLDNDGITVYENGCSLDDIVRYERINESTLKYVKSIKLDKSKFPLRMLSNWKDMLSVNTGKEELDELVAENEWDIGSLFTRVLLECDLDPFDEKPEFDSEIAGYKLENLPTEKIFPNIQSLGLRGKLHGGRFSMRNYAEALAELIAESKEDSFYPLAFALSERIKDIVYSDEEGFGETELLQNGIMLEIDEILTRNSYVYANDDTVPTSTEEKIEEKKISTESLKKLTRISGLSPYEIVLCYLRQCLDIKAKKQGEGCMVFPSPNYDYFFMIDTGGDNDNE